MRGFLSTTIVALSFLGASGQNSTPAVVTYAPVPSTGNGPPVPTSVGFRVEAFGDGAYLLTDGVYQSMFLVACDSVIVVDAPPTIGHNMLKGIRTVTNLPISHVVYSHAHADHIGAAYLLKGKNTTFIAHAETAQELAQANDKTRPAPNITFTGDHNLKVCNQTLMLSYKGPNHQPGNIFIYAPQQKILMLVDIIYPGWVPFDYLGESQNIPGYIKAHDQVLAYDFDHFIGGHINRAGTREDVNIQKEYITDLRDNCAEAIRLSGLPPNATNPLSAYASLSGIETANPGNSWAIFNYYIDELLVGWADNKTTAKWLGRLAGADVYGKSNALIMIESLRIDFGILGPYGVADA
jgi:glyoxylase-like metal-dependent hydrolase (beta-lactamase superfamily II)